MYDASRPQSGRTFIEIEHRLIPVVRLKLKFLGQASGSSYKVFYDIAYKPYGGGSTDCYTRIRFLDRPGSITEDSIFRRMYQGYTETTGLSRARSFFPTALLLRTDYIGPFKLE